MGLLDRFFGRNPEHVVRDLLQQSNGLKVGDLPRFQQRFAARLRELGEPAVDPLIAQFDDASGNPRFLIAQSLAAMSAGDFGTDTGVRIRDWLITALKDKDPTVRDVVAMHICRCRDVAVLEPLIRCALGDPSKGTRDIARDSALKFIAELHRLPAEARHDFEPLFQRLRAACADFPEDDLTRAVDALARTTTAAEEPVSGEAGKIARTTATKYKQALKYLDEAEQLNAEVLQEANRIAGSPFSSSEMQSSIDQSALMLPIGGRPGGLEALRDMFRSTLVEGIRTFDALADELAQGANVNLTNKFGATALDVTYSNGDDVRYRSIYAEIAALLRARGAKLEFHGQDLPRGDDPARAAASTVAGAQTGPPDGMQMGTYVCDVCSTSLPRSEVKFCDSATMHRAVRNGLNPWKTPGISSPSANLAAFFGMGPDDLYQSWRERALADMTPWGLCPSCNQVVGRM